MKNIIGLEKAVKDYKNYNKQCAPDEFAALFLNIDTGELHARILKDRPDVDRFVIICDETGIDAGSLDWIDHHLALLSDIENFEYEVNVENVKMFCEDYVR